MDSNTNCDQSIISNNDKKIKSLILVLDGIMLIR